MTKENYEMLVKAKDYDALYHELLISTGFAAVDPSGKIVDSRFVEKCVKMTKRASDGA